VRGRSREAAPVDCPRLGRRMETVSVGWSFAMGDRLSDAVEYGLPRRLMTVLLFSLAGIFAVLLIISTSDKGSIAFCSFGSALLAVFWPLVAKVESLKIGPTGVELSKKVDEANAKAAVADSKADAALATLTRFVFNSMPQLSTGFGTFGMSECFRQQLRYLRDSGYIRTNDIAIADIPAAGDELSQFVYATSLGKEFIAQRLAAEAAAPMSLVQKS
jgi:hypothetical protein